MDHGFRLHDDGCLEISVPKGTKIENVWVRFCGEKDGASKIFTPGDIKVSEPEPEEIEELEDCITGGNYKSISIVEPKDCTFNFCSGND